MRFYKFLVCRRCICVLVLFEKKNPEKEEEIDENLGRTGERETDEKTDETDREKKIRMLVDSTGN